MHAEMLGSIDDLAAHEAEAERKTDSLVVADLHGFAERDPEPPRYALDPLIPSGLVTLLGAHGGAGKSVLALTLAAHFAAGRSWAGMTPAGGTALFVSLEDSADLVLYRLRKIADTHGLDADAIESGLVIVDGTTGDGALVSEYSIAGVRTIMPTPNMERLVELAEGSGLIVVDNASDAFDGNENERRQVRGFVRMLAQVARDNDAGMLLLAHLDKHAAKHGGAGNSYSGSTAWHNSARSRLAIIERDGQPRLVHEKANLGPKADPVPLEWTDSGVLVPRNCTGESASQDEARERQDAERLLKAMQAAQAADTNVPAARSGPATAQHVLQTFRELPDELHGKEGRRRFWRAMSRLMDQERVSSETYKAANRHEKTRLKVTGVRQ